MSERDLGLKLQAAGSTLVHAVPAVRGLANHVFMKLTGPSDRLLRWRVDERGRDLSTEGNWEELERHASADPHDPSTWRNDMLAVDNHRLKEALVDSQGSVPSVACRKAGGAAVLFGVRELGTDNFLAPVDVDGRPKSDGRYMATIVRTCDGWEAAIGIARVKERAFTPLPTGVLLRNVVDVPAGLHRV